MTILAELIKADHFMILPNKIIIFVFIVNADNKMISYFYHKKGILRLDDINYSGNEGKAALEESPNCEDSLTAIVFDGLKYLPAEMFWRILKASLYHKDKLPPECGEIETVSFWERWKYQQTWREPDLFIRSKTAHIIIEAKQNKYNPQRREQMEEQIDAYHNQFGHSDKSLHFIQCDGLCDVEDAGNYIYEGKIDDKSYRNDWIICKTDWSRILDAIIAEKKRQESINSTEANAYIRIMDDIIKGMELHQHYKLHWISELKSQNINNYSLGNVFCYARRQ